MDIIQIICDIGIAINRVIQKFEEKIFDSEKTEYDDEYVGNVRKLDTLLRFTEVLIDDTESMLEPNPAYRLEGKIMEKVERRNDRTTPLENLGAAFENASHDVKPYHYQLYKYFALCSKYQTKLGIASKEFQNRASDIYVTKLKQMLNVDLKKYKDEEEILEKLRLDYDSLRIRIKKALTVSGKESLEKEFEQVKPTFLKQLDSNISYFRTIDQFFEVHRDLLKEFVDSQSEYYKECHCDLEKFKTKMESLNLYSYNDGDSSIYGSVYTSLRKEDVSIITKTVVELPADIINDDSRVEDKLNPAIDSPYLNDLQTSSVHLEINHVLQPSTFKNNPEILPVNDDDVNLSDKSFPIKSHANVNGVDITTKHSKNDELAVETNLLLEISSIENEVNDETVKKADEQNLLKKKTLERPNGTENEQIVEDNSTKVDGDDIVKEENSSDDSHNIEQINNNDVEFERKNQNNDIEDLNVDSKEEQRGNSK